MVNGEVGLGRDPTREIIQLESAFNRAQIRGQSLAHVLMSVKDDPKRGYYASTTYNRPVTPQQLQYFTDKILTPVMAGSNEGTRFLGKPVTGNASQMDFAGRKLASGEYASGKWYGQPGGRSEMFVQERFDANRLAQNPNLLYGGGAVSAPAAPGPANPAGEPKPSAFPVAASTPVRLASAPVAAPTVSPPAGSSQPSAAKAPDLFGGLAKTLGLFGGGMETSPATSSAAPASALAAAEAQKASFEALNSPRTPPVATPFADVIGDSSKFNALLDPKGLFLGLS
jgi:hypothetical protein